MWLNGLMWLSLWGTTHLWEDRRSWNRDFNWHIQLFLFWIGSQAWWSRNCLTWWSVDVSQQQSDWELGPLLLQLSPLSMETNCCCQPKNQKTKKERKRRKKTQWHQSLQPSLSLWFSLLVDKALNGLTVQLASEKDVWSATTHLQLTAG